MSVVTYFVETSQGYLDTAAETQFGSVAATVGTLLVLGTTLVVILVFLNMIYQYKAMDGLTCHGIFPPFGIRVRPNEGTDNEANEIQRRTDHRHPDGA